MTRATWLHRTAGLLALLALAFASVTSGLAVRCGMPRHCAACPVEPGPSLVTAGCPMMSPAAPRLAASQRAVAAPDVAVAIVAISLPSLVSSGLPDPIALSSDRSAPPGSPPGHSVLRV